MSKKIKNLKCFIGDKTAKQLNNETKFDILGNETETITYFTDGNLETRVITVYNSNNQKTEQTTFSEDNEFAEKSVFSWDENGKLISEEILYADNSKSLRTFSRDHKNNSLTATLVDEDNELEEKEIIVFNQSNEIIEKTVFDENEQIIEKIENTYHENKLIKQLETGAKNEFVAEKKYSYDDKGNLIKRITLNSDNEVINLVRFTYDEFNRLIEQNINNSYLIRFSFDDENHTTTEERLLSNGILQYSKISKFDENNLLIEENGSEGNKTYIYEFFEENL